MFDIRTVASAWIAGFLVVALAMGALALVTKAPAVTEAATGEQR